MAKKVITENKSKKTATKSTAKKQTSNVHKIKILVTVVDKSKSIFYVDLLEQFEVNVQMVLYGRGTANSQMLDLLGINEIDKAVIFSFIREDKIKDAMETLNEKFKTVKNGKGIAYTIALDSIIGVSMYQLLSNDKTVKEGGKK